MAAPQKYHLSLTGEAYILYHTFSFAFILILDGWSLKKSNEITQKMSR